MFSNSYIFRFATIMVVVVAALLSAAALLLKPMQDRNIRIEKMQDILSAAGIASSAGNAIELYDKHLVKELTANLAGEITSVYAGNTFEQGNVRAFDINVRDMQKQIEAVRKGSSSAEPLLPVFVMRSKEGALKYVFPVRGVGLWGPVWGNIALSEDLETITGVKFDHKAETPGLGAEISTEAFADQFINKKIFNNESAFVSVKVVKGTAGGSHEVDAISGGTITSNGVSDMIQTGLENYLPFIKSYKAL